MLRHVETPDSQIVQAAIVEVEGEDSEEDQRRSKHASISESASKPSGDNSTPSRIQKDSHYFHEEEGVNKSDVSHSPLVGDNKEQSQVETSIVQKQMSGIALNDDNHNVGSTGIGNVTGIEEVSGHRALFYTNMDLSVDINVSNSHNISSKVASPVKDSSRELQARSPVKPTHASDLLIASPPRNTQYSSPTVAAHEGLHEQSPQRQQQQASLTSVPPSPVPEPVSTPQSTAQSTPLSTPKLAPQPAAGVQSDSPSPPKLSTADLKTPDHFSSPYMYNQHEDAYNQNTPMPPESTTPPKPSPLKKMLPIVETTSETAAAMVMPTSLRTNEFNNLRTSEPTGVVTGDTDHSKTDKSNRMQAQSRAHTSGGDEESMLSFPSALTPSPRSSPRPAPLRHLNSSSSMMSMLSHGRNNYVPTSLPDVNLDVQAFDAVMNYYRPFLLSAKYLEDPNLRGWKTHRTLHLQCNVDEEVVLYTIFQMYGSSDALVVKSIKTAQIARAIQDAKIAKTTSSQLDLELLRINAKLLAKTPTKEQKVKVSKTGSAIVSASTVNVNSMGTFKSDPVPAHCAAYNIYKELLQVAALTSSAVKKDATIDVMQVVHRAFSDLIKRKDLTYFCRASVDFQITASGQFLRSVYARYTFYATELAFRKALESDAERSAPLQPIRVFSDEEIELVRAVWDRNLDQIRQIYAFYATSVEIRRVGSGVSKLLLSADKCREMLQDFQLLPQVVDMQAFYRVFRSVKLWEWNIAESVLLFLHHSGQTGDNVSVQPGASPAHNQFMPDNNDIRSVGMGGGSVAGFEHDPLDFRSSLGNFSITIGGFVELLSRITCYNTKLCAHPAEALENAMHLMDASEGKAKLLRSSRQNMSTVRHFVYSWKK
eukprot:gene30121-36387_t